MPQVSQYCEENINLIKDYITALLENMFPPYRSPYNKEGSLQ
jgi:hypothetical protein